MLDHISDYELGAGTISSPESIASHLERRLERAWGMIEQGEAEGRVGEAWYRRLVELLDEYEAAIDAERVAA